KEWNTYSSLSSLNEEVEELVNAEFSLLAEFIFETPDDVNFEDLFPKGEWSYDDLPVEGDVFEIKRRGAENPVLIFTKKTIIDNEGASKNIYEGRLGEGFKDGEEGEKLLVRHYYEAEQEEDNVVSKPKISIVAWLNKKVDPLSGSDLFKPA